MIINLYHITARLLPVQQFIICIPVFLFFNCFFFLVLTFKRHFKGKRLFLSPSRTFKVTVFGKIAFSRHFLFLPTHSQIPHNILPKQIK